MLGCSIVVTLCLGCAKLAYTHWTLRKYAVVAEKERQEQAQHREMLQKSSTPTSERGEEIPFGVRAIERGIEVEGVYISRPNTPDSAKRNGPHRSSSLGFLPNAGPVPDLERQISSSRLSQPDRMISNSTVRPTRPTSSAFEQAVSVERLSSSRNSRESLTTLPLEKPTNSRHPPPSFAKYSGNPSLYPWSSCANTLEGIEAIHRASTSLRSDTHFDDGSGDSYTQSSSGSSDSGPIASAAPNLLNQAAQTQPTPRVRHYLVDFEMLNNRRMSQAAETGQLTPCVKKPPKIAELPGSFPVGYSLKNDGDAGYFAIKTAQSTQSSPGSSNENSPTSPRLDALPAALRRSSMPEGVTPFAQFVQTASSSSRPASLKSLSSPERSRPMSEVPSVYASAPSSPTKPGTAQQPINRPMLRSSEKERPPSQVIRGEGSGFEILKPGSLHPVMPVEQLDEKQRAVPPVSLHNYGRSGSRSSSTGRKLQKKRRPSVDSHTSSESGKRTSAFEVP